MYEIKITCNTPEELREAAMRLTIPIVTDNGGQQPAPTPQVEVTTTDSAQPQTVPTAEVTPINNSLFPAEDAEPAEPAVDNELDANGVPWDSRIHAGTKTRTAKNVWKKKKGVDEATYNAVMAELTGAAASGGPNHSQLLQQMVDGFADSSLSIFQVSDALVNNGLSSLNEASGNNELIEKLARELGLL